MQSIVKISFQSVDAFILRCLFSGASQFVCERCGGGAKSSECLKLDFSKIISHLSRIVLRICEAHPCVQGVWEWLSPLSARMQMKTTYLSTTTKENCLTMCYIVPKWKGRRLTSALLQVLLQKKCAIFARWSTSKERMFYKIT